MHYRYDVYEIAILATLMDPLSYQAASYQEVPRAGAEHGHENLSSELVIRNLS